ncbi:hypothetical protein [Longibaculum muris]|uniref:hypothetical protein n=1 Tax=Longibaculum muris TaxID=1796628 RepID=UPI0022E014D3|nr:hypothetical protein [Longibaculum muris]
MNQEQLIGNTVLIMITLGSFVAVIQRFTQPIHELKIVIQELKDCIVILRNDNEIQNKRIEKHGEEIDELKMRVNCIDKDVHLLKHGGSEKNGKNECR